MLNAEKNRLHKSNEPEQATLAERNTARIYISEFSASKIKEALISD